MSDTQDTKPLRLLKNDKAHAHRYKDAIDAKPSDKLPLPPDNLSERAKEIFIEFVSRVAEMYQPSDTDVDAIVLYANNKEQLESYEIFLRENGSTFEQFTQFGSVIKPRPEVSMLKDCKALQVTLMKEFGMSPSSRSKVKLKKPETKKVNPFSQVNNQKQG
jgi:P27 family predicted phage terminase small subunit